MSLFLYVYGSGALLAGQNTGTYNIKSEERNLVNKMLQREIG